MYNIKDFKIINNSGHELDLEADVKVQLSNSMYHVSDEDNIFVTSIYYDDVEESGLMFSHRGPKANFVIDTLSSLITKE